MKYRHVRSILRVFNQLLRVLMCRPVASSSRVPTDGMRNLSTVTSVPVQPQTPMQYRPAQSMPPSLTDAMRNFSIGTSTRVASVRVQGQPPMQQIAKTTTNTAVVSLPLVPSSSKLVKPRARQGFGSVGKKIMITANHFLVQLGDKNPHQYDVTITPEVTSKTKCKHIMKCLIEQYKASHLGNHGFAYDGNKSAFAAGPLPFKNKEFVIVVPEKDGHDSSSQLLRVTNMYNPQETIQALDIALKEVASHELSAWQVVSTCCRDSVKSASNRNGAYSVLTCQMPTKRKLSLLKGRFLRFVQDKKSTSVPVQERHRVLDYQRVQLLPQTETIESSGQYHDGSDDRSQETHHFNLPHQTLELESDYDTAELRELSKRRRVSNLLQMNARNKHLNLSNKKVYLRMMVSARLFRAQKEREIINGLRIDMVRLQEQMNSLQSTLETCMKMQHELQRSVQQEVWSALSRLSTSGEDSLETCFLCCDNSSYDFSSDRCGRVHVCSNCAKKINWSKLKESVRHP
ncbi:argonaute/Dicer protein, PAZ [Tanacetum coccineum]|uniref:Argonaute/Dicer protein, PAZ n=1 Tax=Tanacetum coccineum TaxID=301880 RepID=A0ABQ4X2U2_9ASTR